MTTMLPQRIDTYIPESILGEGGMGVVYRARHAVTGRVVALKTVRMQGTGNTGAIRREIAALAALDHPGVVRILDHGQTAQRQPWYAMELIEGTTLHQFMRTSSQPHDSDVWWSETFDSDGHTQQPPDPSLAAPPRGRMPDRLAAEDDTWVLEPSTAAVAAPLRWPPDADNDPIAMVESLCWSLAYLHDRGLVHRDIKPANVIVGSDGAPVLVDFGLATQGGRNMGREHMTLAASTGATLAYAAPEQLLGEWIDARADLYAIGCVLYEVLTGRTPFVSHVPLRLVEQHVNDAPIPPRQLSPELPEALEALVLALLAKRPHNRPGYAEDVARQLADHRLGPPPSVPRQRARYLYRPALAGRAQTLAELTRLASRRAGVTVVHGPSGAGKTRLVIEMLRRRETRGLDLIGECAAPGGDGYGRPLQPLRRPLAALVDELAEWDASSLPRLLGKNGRALEPYAPQLATLPGWDRLPALGKLPAPAARTRLFDTLWAVLRRMSRRKPILLVLDDLQWADELTLALLAHILDDGLVRRSALRIVATVRDDEDVSALSSIMAHDATRALGVSRLDPSAVAEMAGSMLARDDLPASFTTWLTERASGNPFFVAESLRSAVEAGLLARSAGRWQIASDHGDSFDTLPIPQTLQDVLRARLDRLPEDVRTVVDAAAVAGRAIDERVLAHVLGLEPVELDRQFVVLVARQLVDEGDDGLRFAHDKVHELAYALLPDARRAALHEATADALAAVYEGDESRLGAIAFHLAAAVEAGDHSEALVLRAARMQVRAAAQAIAIGSLATELYERCGPLLEHAPPSEQRDACEALLHTSRLLGSVYFAGNRSEQQEVSYRRLRALGHVSDPDVMAPALYSQWMYLLATARYGELDRPCNELFEIARDSGVPALVFQAHHTGWANDLLLGRFQASIEHASIGLGMHGTPGVAGGVDFHGGHDAPSCALSHSGIARCRLGDHTGASQSLQALLDRSDHLRTSFERMHWCTIGVILAAEVDDLEALALLLDHFEKNFRHQGVLLGSDTLRFLQSYLAWRSTGRIEGLHDNGRVVTALRAAKVPVAPHLTMLHARMCIDAAPMEALETLDAVALPFRAVERHYLAASLDAYRARALATFGDPPASIAATFRRAHDTAVRIDDIATLLDNARAHAEWLAGRGKHSEAERVRAAALEAAGERGDPVVREALRSGRP